MKEKATKKHSALRKLIPAACMLLVSATTLVSSTYAWFTMNKTVTVSNLAVQAKAEGGLLISEESGTSAQWDDEANTTTEVADAKVALYPTSTADSKTWYHATSKTANNAANATAASTESTLKSVGYDTLSLTAYQLQAAASGANGKKEVYFSDTNTATSGYDAADAKYYLKYTYYLKLSNESGMTNTQLGVVQNKQNVAITQVTASGANTSAELDKSLRVGIAIGGKFYIFAPISGATGTYWVAAGANNTTAINSSSSATEGNMTEYTALDQLPGVTGTGTPVYIYMWYEGEDAACKSDNIASSLDELTVTVKFSLVNITSASPEDHGVTIPTT